MNKVLLGSLCALGAMLAGVQAAPVLAQTAVATPVLMQSGTKLARLTVAELAGNWVEPETNSDENGMIIRGSENLVEITRDGRFTDGLDLSFVFDNAPEYNGTYRIATSGRVSIANGAITWDTQTATVVPQFPADASEAERAEMQDFADRMAEGMISSETYPMISYDGREMVMDAGDGGISDEYVMTRR